MYRTVNKATDTAERSLTSPARGFFTSIECSMKTVLFSMALIATAPANSAIFNCGNAVFSDKPCADGKGDKIKEQAPGSTIKINFIETQSTYTIDTPDPNQVNAIMRAQTWSAYNQSSHPKIEYTTKTRGNECEIETATITLTNRNHMPEWTYYSRATTEEKRNWNVFYEGTTIHENGHRAIAREFTIFLRQQLAGIGTKPCDTLHKWVEQFQSTAWTQLRDRQEQYDADTQHGITQMGRR